ncbi:hypothetical protein VKT23_019659 [Stygiomarasmius scandens]|uniref:Uncharacterized protein n=1 Tax=Marasmiellus scandens TaxID=2682957 RepID=A0ABR1IPW6_9AGAR
MSYHQRQQSRSTFRDPSPNPSLPPVPSQPPPRPRREERASCNPTSELKTVLFPGNLRLGD